MSDTREPNDDAMILAREQAWRTFRDAHPRMNIPYALPLFFGGWDAARASQPEALAEAWDEGARWAAVEMGVYPNESQQWLVPSDNPYRKATQ
jgi:hypothetical protein